MALTKIRQEQGVVINDGSTDVDFRVESNGNTHMLFVDGGNDRVLVGKTTSGLGNIGVEFEDGQIKGTADGVTVQYLNRTSSAGTILDLRIDNTTKGEIAVESTGLVINEAGADLDFRVESDNNPHSFMVDAATDAILFGKAAAGLTTNGAYMAGAVTTVGSHFHLGLSNTVADTSSVLYINRQSADGVLIEFRHANSVEGTISVSGATVSYNGFSGRHESSGIPANTPVGTVVSTINALDVYSATQTDPEGGVVPNPKAGQTRANHAQVEVSNSAGDSCVYGVVSEFDGSGKLIVTSVGIGSIRVTGACSKGDLLESNGDGTAKVQSDDIIRSKTIGKVTIGNSSSSVKLVSCVLYCG